MEVWWIDVICVLIATLIAVVCGLNAALAAAISFVTCYVLFIFASSGWKLADTTETWAMALGFGLMITMFVSMGIAIAVLLGRLLRGARWPGTGTLAPDSQLRSPQPPPKS